MYIDRTRPQQGEMLSPQEREAQLPRPQNIQEMLQTVGINPTHFTSDFVAGAALFEKTGAHDAYLHTLAAVGIAGSDAVAVVKQAIPGHLEYFSEKFGLAPGQIQITDSAPFSPVIADSFDWSNVGMLASSFPDHFYPGERTVSTREAQSLADSKARLHEVGARRYGVPVIQGAVARTPSDVLYYTKQLSDNFTQGVVVKRGDSGCGGDFTRAVTSQAQTEQALTELYEKSDDSTPIVIEMDARVHKAYADEQIVANVCLTAAVGPSGSQIFDVTRQKFIPGTDTWLGSERTHLPDDQFAVVKAGYERFAQYHAEGCNFYGSHGPDVYVMQNKKTGLLKAVYFDANARPPISEYSVLASNALGYRAFTNVNVILPFGVEDFSQIQEAGLDLPNLVWLASKSVPASQHSEAVPSPWFKVMIGGETPQDVDETWNYLTAQGVTLPR